MIIVCSACPRAIQVRGDLCEIRTLVGQESSYWPDGYRCFDCGKECIAGEAADFGHDVLSRLDIVELTPQETVAALEGLGIPEEHTCCAEVIEPLFEACGVKIHGRQLRGKTRYFVNYFEMPDGTRLYLGASPAGALIYRISKKHSYAEAVSEDSAGVQKDG